MLLLFVYVFIALAFSFLCSLLEATLLTLSPTTIEAAKRRGTKWAVRMGQLKADIDRPLSAILTLNTVAHTMGAAGAGSQYAKIYGSATVGVFGGLLTLAILIFTEIIPKTLGARHAEFLAGPTAWILPRLQTLLAPLVWLCRQITRLITFGKADASPRHREELLAVARLAEAHGELKESETTIVRNILHLGEVHVSDIMTPWPVVFSLSAAMPLTDAADAICNKPFSRILIHDGHHDHVVGFVIRSEVLYACLKNPGGSLGDLVRPVGAVPRHFSVEILLQSLLSENRHLMLVHDEFGTNVGLVTLEDALETIVGVEIVDENDNNPDLQAVARKLWEERAARMGLVRAEPS